MKSFITRRGTLFWLLILLFLFISVGYFVTPNGPEKYPDYVSDSPSPTGVKAFFTYLKNEDDHVQQWSHTPDLFPEEDSPGLLIMAGPSFTPGKDVMGDYKSFMEAGNTILLLKTNPDGMLNIKTEPVMADDTEKDLEDEDGTSYEADKNETARITPDDNDTVLLEDDNGVIATKTDYQDGALITAVSPEWMTNEKITEDDHLTLLFNLIAEENQDWGAIYFDEYMHGDENAATIDTLYPKWLLMTSFQVVILIVLLLWYRGKRFGSIIIPREETVRFSNERIRALAAWYHRGHLYTDSLTQQADFVKLLLQGRWGIAYHRDWQAIAQEIERRVQRIAGEDIPTFSSGLERILAKKRITKREYLLWSRRLDILQKEVEET